MQITDAAIFEVLAARRTRHRFGTPVAGPLRRPFPWVGAGVPFSFPLKGGTPPEAPTEAHSPLAAARGSERAAASEAAKEDAREGLGVVVTAVAILVAALL